MGCGPEDRGRILLSVGWYIPPYTECYIPEDSSQDKLAKKKRLNKT